jgi:hypothetical protein
LVVAAAKNPKLDFISTGLTGKKQEIVVILFPSVLVQQVL